MKTERRDLLRSIPSMDVLLSLPWVAQMERELGREAIKSAFNEVLDEVRAEVRRGSPLEASELPALVAGRARSLIARRASPGLRRVVNATGVVVHTNLGRSPLPEEALRAVWDVSCGYSTLEYSLEDGARGHRNAHVEWLLRQLTGAEAAIVVNNNASAVLLALAALAKGREVIVSRGELVEIGGSFRIPDILAFSGAQMVAVGCTNCTHPSDYQDAIGPDTALLLKVHPSNFRIEGFTKSVTREELAALARERGLVCMEDLGSGLLEEPGVRELGGEATVRACIAAGVDIVTFSGDKLLGGPQIGCVAGSRTLIDDMRRNPLIRALRVDKMTLAAFEVVLRLYLKGNHDEIPTMAMLRCDRELLLQRAERLKETIRGLLAEFGLHTYSAGLIETDDAVGGGAYPGVPLPGWGVAFSAGAGVKPERMAALLRSVDVPIVTGIQDGALVFHVRTLTETDFRDIERGFRKIFERRGQ